MLTRWLLIGLLVSVGVLLLVAGALVHHIRKQRRGRGTEVLDPELTRALGDDPDSETHKDSEDTDSKGL